MARIKFYNSTTGQWEYADGSGGKMPVRLSELENDSGFVTATTEALINYYTKKQLDELISAIPRFEVKVVSDLPESGNELTIYLVREVETENLYTEYLWVDNTWEELGSQSANIDLSEYAKLDQVDDRIDSHNLVSYVEQTLTEEQQMRARQNLGLYGYEYRHPLMYELEWVYGSPAGESDITMDTGTAIVEIRKDNDSATYMCTRSEMTDENGGTHYWYGNSTLLTSLSEVEATYPEVPFLIYLHDADPATRKFVVEDSLMPFSGNSIYFSVYDAECDEFVINTVPEQYLPEMDKTSLGIAGATVGQIAKITAVDENGKPTKWKAADFPKNEGTVKSVNNVVPDENGNVEIEVGGELVQSDWNQHDPEQPDYVKNRPFYSHTEGESDYLVEPMDLQFVYGEVYPDNPIVVSTDDFAKGNVLCVVWDGTVYECTVKYHNMAMFNYIGGEDEPFTISDDNGTGELRIENAQSTFTGTVSFALAKSLAKTTLVRMDEKYLPESVKAGLENVNTRVDKINSRIDATNTELEAAMQNIPHGEIVPDRIYEDVGKGSIGLCSDITPDISAIIGAKVFLNSQESGLVEHYVTAADITQYDWGYDFKYGCVVTMEDAEGAPGGDLGLYMRAAYDWLDDRFTPQYASYGLVIITRLDEDYLPQSVPNVQMAKVGQVLVVEAVDENGKPTGWKTIDTITPEFLQAVNSASEVGMGLVVNSVDENGKPTGWEVRKLYREWRAGFVSPDNSNIPVENDLVTVPIPNIYDGEEALIHITLHDVTTGRSIDGDGKTLIKVNISERDDPSGHVMCWFALPENTTYEIIEFYASVVRMHMGSYITVCIRDASIGTTPLGKEQLNLTLIDKLADIFDYEGEYYITIDGFTSGAADVIVDFR